MFPFYQVGKIGVILTLLYCLMMVPIMLLYRYMELQGDLVTVPVPRLDERMDNMSGRKYPPRYDESECHFRFLVYTTPSTQYEVLSVMWRGSTGRKHY